MKTSVFVGLSKRTRQTRSLETSRRPWRCRAGLVAGATTARGGGGGYDGGFGLFDVIGQPIAKYWTKACRFEL